MPVQMLKRPPKPACERNHSAVLVRMPPELHEELKRFALAGYRSVTGEIVQRLKESLENQSIDEHGVIVVHSSTSLK